MSLFKIGTHSPNLYSLALYAKSLVPAYCTAIDAAPPCRIFQVQVFASSAHTLVILSSCRSEDFFLLSLVLGNRRRIRSSQSWQPLSASISKFKELESTDSCTTGGSMESKFHTAVAPESELATTSSLSFISAGSESALASTSSSEREERIERSKVHWSQLSEPACNRDEQGVMEIENREVFKTLQLHPTWGRFFQTFGYDTEIFVSIGSLEVGEKFAEGGQAELFHAHITWEDSQMNDCDLVKGTEYVLKVFKKGTSLQQLQSYWPHGFLQYRAEEYEQSKLGKRAPIRYFCNVKFGTLLKDGRFAFLMVKEHEDLRSVIDRYMETNCGKNHGPFKKDSEDAEMVMYRIALGMDWLHNRNIVHRDLKASNVLMKKHRIYGTWTCFVADFECSIGVIGTGFWRAPEILQACKEKNVFQKPEIFSKKVDIYSFGMTCYEILTGKHPFEDYPWSDYDLVINGKRPEIPEYIEDWACGLLNWCWHPNPADRPSFQDILIILEANSARVRRYKMEKEARESAHIL